MAHATRESEKETFVETALKMGGKGEEEARRTGAVDRADEQVEELFAVRYQTVASPAHRAVWDREFPVELFTLEGRSASAACQKVMEQSLDVVRHRKREGTMFGADGRVRPEVLEELGDKGYWGLLVGEKYGGSGAPFSAFASFLTRMTIEDGTVAGLASVHGCIGAVDPLEIFGSEEQKTRFFPKLATGKSLSAFALTEPGSGSDLTAMGTRAELRGDKYIVNGEKLFITTAIPGRTIGLVCVIEDRPAVLLVELPEEENEHFQIVTYGLHALKHSYNNGLRFVNLEVPVENLLTPPHGDGLTIAYHGLNRGRVALCAAAAGNMRVFLANMLPWAKYRRTYGAAIESRELVQRRVGRLAALIVGADSLVEWCAGLLDQGYRGEMECIIAKIFGSEAQKEAAIELLMKTHGGRAFLHGHILGDNVHEYLAPCIYEGEGEMLGLGFFKSLIKEHGKKHFEPVGRAAQQAGLAAPNPRNPIHLWKIRKGLAPYAKWRLRQLIAGPRQAQLPDLPRPLAAHAQYAAAALQRSRMDVDALMRKHQLRMPDRQCAMAELSQRVQDLVLMFTTAVRVGGKANVDELVVTAADVLCRDLKRGLTGARPSSSYFRTVTELGDSIASGGFSAIAGIEPEEILMPYDS